MSRLAIALLATSVVAAPGLTAQQPSASPIVGTWRVDLRSGPQKEGPKLVVVRADSSASWGTETVRWRITGDRLALAIGGEWEVYRLKVKGTSLTLSEGDLQKPVTFRKVGPPTPRPATVAVPPDPDTEQD